MAVPDSKHQPFFSSAGRVQAGRVQCTHRDACLLLCSSVQLNHVLATLADYIVPLPDEKDVDDTAAWTDRFLLVESSLATVPQRQGLMNATRLTERLNGGVWTAYIDACMNYNVSPDLPPSLARGGARSYRGLRPLLTRIPRWSQGGLVDDKEMEKVIKEFLRKAIAQMSGALSRLDSWRH